MPDKWRLPPGRALACVALGGAFLSAVALCAVQSVAVQRVRAASPQLRFGLPPDEAKAAKAALPPPAIVRRALAAEPLHPATVNTAIFAAAERDGAGGLTDPRLALLAQLGWRHTPALQNLILAAVNQQDLAGTVDIVDALLRRRAVVDQATAVMNLIELDPRTRGLVVERLARGPSWRLRYLQTVDQLRTPAQVAARGALAESLQRMGAPPQRDELLPITARMVQADQVGLAYRLWRSYRRAAALPVNDPGFDWAYATRGYEAIGMPFEWRLLNGEGHWAELERAGSDAQVAVHWNGRGAPELLTQQLWLRPGRYRLTVAGEDLPPALLESFSFSLRCPRGTTAFDRVAARGEGRLRLSADASTPCAAPVLVVAGRPRDTRVGDADPSLGGDELTLRLSELRLQPANA